MTKEFTPAPLLPALDFANQQIPAHGWMGVDYEQRVEIYRLGEANPSKKLSALLPGTQRNQGQP